MIALEQKLERWYLLESLLRKMIVIEAESEAWFEIQLMTEDTILVEAVVVVLLLAMHDAAVEAVEVELEIRNCGPANHTSSETFECGLAALGLHV